MKKQIITSTRIQYSVECSICGEEIKAFSKSNLKYNLRLHKEKCVRELDEKQNETANTNKN